MGTTAQAATITLDLATVSGTWQTIDLTTATNITLATSNRAAGRYVKLWILNNSGGSRTINYGVTKVSSPNMTPPTTLANGEDAFIDIFCIGTTTADIIATGSKYA